MSSCGRAVRSCIRGCLRGRPAGFHMLSDPTEAPAPAESDQQEGVRDAEPTEPLVSARPGSSAQAPPPPAAAYLAVMRHSVRESGKGDGGRRGFATRTRARASARKSTRRSPPRYRSASTATTTRSGPSKRRGRTTRPSPTGTSRRASARRCDGSASIASSPHLSGGVSRRRASSPRRSE